MTFNDLQRALLASISIRWSDAKGLTRHHLSGTEPQALTEEMMKAKVEKIGPGSWAVIVNGQRHHETFPTRAAARREAKRHEEANKIDNEART